MKLYYAKKACSLAVRILIYEINIPCEFESVNLKTKQTESGTDYLSINPKGAVPALLLDNGAVLTENVVVQQYLADSHHAWQLLPPETDFKRYRVLEWLNFITTDLHKTAGPLFYADYPEAIKENIIKPKLKKNLGFIDNHLKQSEYLVGDQFTAADCYLFVIITWLPGFNISLTDWPNLLRYANHLKTRASIIKAMQAENISL